MKLIRNFTFCIVNFTFILAAQAVPSWATLNTAGYTGSTEASAYSAYLMSASDAANTFGGASVADIEDYFAAQAATGTFSIEAPKGATAFSGPYFYDGQYTLDVYEGTGYSSADAIAVVFYGTIAYRVFGAGSAELVGSSLVFDDITAEGTTVGDWQMVPEPTSALLLLLGLSALAMKRKQSA